MSRTKLILCLAVALVAGLIAAEARSQTFQPFIDPDYFHPDLQFFAPAELTEYGGEPTPNTGWFGSFDRVWTYVSRPRSEASYTDGDFTYGYRWELGYMTERNHGWSASFMQIQGPNAANVVRQERLNRYVEPDTGNNNGGGGTGGGTGAQEPTFPASDRNDGVTGERTYDLTNSLNYGRLNAFDINKTFRLEPLHRGSILEPYFGVRLNQFRDRTRRDVYDRFADDGTPVPVLPDANVALDDAVLERLSENLWQVTNNMVGGQLGVRWYTEKSRWTLDSDFRVFAMQNFQSLTFQNYTTTTLYDGAGTGSEVVLELRGNQRQDSHNSEFVYGFQVRGQAAYAVTRDFHLRAGLDLTDYAQGVGRGNNFTRLDDGLLLVGLTFGVTLNR